MQSIRGWSQRESSPQVPDRLPPMRAHWNRPDGFPYPPRCMSDLWQIPPHSGWGCPGSAPAPPWQWQRRYSIRIWCQKGNSRQNHVLPPKPQLWWNSCNPADRYESPPAPHRASHSPGWSHRQVHIPWGEASPAVKCSPQKCGSGGYCPCQNHHVQPEVFGNFHFYS